MATVNIREQLGLQDPAYLLKYLNVLFYADPNAGKTYLAGTAQDHPDLSPVLHLGFEQGLLTVAYRKNYDMREIRTIDQFEEVTRLLQEDQASAKPFYKTVIIDNATEVQNLDIDTVMRLAKKTSNTPDKVDIDVPSPREWGKIGKRLRRCVVGIRDLPMHTIWTAWKGEYIDEEYKTVHYYPKLAGHMKHEFSGYFDIVGYLTMGTNGSGEIETKLQIQETKRVKAKWRNKPNVEELKEGVLINPSMPMIWNLVQKSKIATG